MIFSRGLLLGVLSSVRERVNSHYYFNSLETRPLPPQLSHCGAVGSGFWKNWTLRWERSGFETNHRSVQFFHPERTECCGGRGLVSTRMKNWTLRWERSGFNFTHDSPPLFWMYHFWLVLIEPIFASSNAISRVHVGCRSYNSLVSSPAPFHATCVKGGWGQD